MIGSKCRSSVRAPGRSTANRAHFSRMIAARRSTGGASSTEPGGVAVPIQMLEEIQLRYDTAQCAVEAAQRKREAKAKAKKRKRSSQKPKTAERTAAATAAAASPTGPAKRVAAELPPATTSALGSDFEGLGWTSFFVPNTAPRQEMFLAPDSEKEPHILGANMVSSIAAVQAWENYYANVRKRFRSLAQRRFDRLVADRAATRITAADREKIFMEEAEAKCQFIKVGDTVDVMRRKTPGINKDGGRGMVKKSLPPKMRMVICSFSST